MASTIAVTQLYLSSALGVECWHDTSQRPASALTSAVGTQLLWVGIEPEADQSGSGLAVSHKSDQPSTKWGSQCIMLLELEKLEPSMI